MMDGSMDAERYSAQLEGESNLAPSATVSSVSLQEFYPYSLPFACTASCGPSATEGFNSVTLGNATCKVFGGDQCSSCKCKRGLSKCKRAKLIYEIEYSSREWGELQVLKAV